MKNKTNGFWNLESLKANAYFKQIFLQDRFHSHHLANHRYCIDVNIVVVNAYWIVVIIIVDDVVVDVVAPVAIIAEVVVGIETNALVINTIVIRSMRTDALSECQNAL